jgi:TPR repeat protein
MRVALLLMLLAMVVCSGAAPAGASARDAADAYRRGDYAAVLRACRAEAEAGDASCQIWLGILYADGAGVTRDAAAAAGWFRRAAEQGNGVAAYNLARAYQNGEGVTKDLAEARKWARQAADQGIPHAQLQLGLVILEADHDMKAAVPWFKLAAAQGIPMAQTFVGVAYEEGDGARRNYRSAVKWYEVAAEHGDTLAASRLASLYERGLGVDADAEEAYFWYRVALKDSASITRKQDDEGLRRVAAQLSKKQLAAAEKAVRDWQPEEAVVGPPKRGKRKAARQSDEPQLFATGTGFFVSRDGHLLTNNHVVADCRSVRMSDADQGIPAKVLVADAERDLALLQVPRTSPAAVFRGEEKLRAGESVVVVGFPLSGLLTSEPIVSTGIVNALAGPRDDRRLLQISAPIQPGNSGGPLLDSSGHVIGVVVATLSTLKLAKATGTIPENINFAVKATEAQGFLKAQGITVETAALGVTPLPTATVADQALAVTVRLECWR